MRRKVFVVQIADAKVPGAEPTARMAEEAGRGIGVGPVAQGRARRVELGDFGLRDNGAGQ
jgi:hypothetical protein